MITGTQTRKVSEVLEMVKEIFNDQIKIIYDDNMKDKVYSYYSKDFELLGYEK